jgi:hypothetical protein
MQAYVRMKKSSLKISRFSSFDVPGLCQWNQPSYLLSL